MKIQKTLQIDDRIARLVQKYTDRRGLYFQKVVQAAVLQFFFSDRHGPDEQWMEAYMELEKGELLHSLPPPGTIDSWEGLGDQIERMIVEDS